MRKQTVSLKDYLDLLERMHEKEITAVRQAADLFKETANAKAETMNEWRQTYGDMVAHTITRNEFDAAMKNHTDKMETVSKGKVTWGTMVVVSFFSSLLVATIMTIIVLLK